MLRESLLRHGRFYGAENSQNRPVDLIYSCSIGSRHASSMRFAKVLSPNPAIELKSPLGLPL
jgi:hypothetical protein